MAGGSRQCLIMRLVLVLLFEVGADYTCPVSRDLVRPHLADLRRTRSGETPLSDLSHLIWSAVAILSAVSHSIWSTMAILSVAHIPGAQSGDQERHLGEWEDVAHMKRQADLTPGPVPP
jgi:hypothetical protein